MSRAGWLCLAASLFLLQSAVLPFLLYGGWMPDLWLAAAVISVLAFDRKTALTFALAGGAAQDIVAGNFFGLHLFPYLMVTLLTSFFMRERYNRKWLVSVLSVAAGTAVYFVFLWLVVAVSGGRVDIPAYAVYRGLPQIGANALAALVLHNVLWNMKREWEPRW